MEPKRYRVVFSGALLPGHEVEGVAPRLAAAFKIPPERIARYFDGSRRVVRSDLDSGQAERYRRAFERAGAVLEVEESAPASEDQETMLCPKCGSSQPVAESCAMCGIVIAKFKAREPEAAQETPTAAPSEAIPEEQPSTQDAPETSPEESAPAEVEAREPRAHEDEPRSIEAESRENEVAQPPILELRTIRVVDLLATTILVAFLNCLIIGLLTGPRTMWDFLISHVGLEGHRLRNHDLWLGLRPLLWLLVGIAAVIPLGLIVAGIGLAIPRLAVHLSTVLAVPLSFIVLATMNVGMVRALAARTVTRDGDRVFPQPFTLKPSSMVSFLKRSWKLFLLGGVAMVANLTLFLAPIGTAITLTQLFNLLEVDGHRYRLQVPWKKALIWSAICIPTAGLANLFFVRVYFNEVLPDGSWERIAGNPPRPSGVVA